MSPFSVAGKLHDQLHDAFVHLFALKIFGKEEGWVFIFQNHEAKEVGGTVVSFLLCWHFLPAIRRGVDKCSSFVDV